VPRVIGFFFFLANDHVISCLNFEFHTNDIENGTSYQNWLLLSTTCVVVIMNKLWFCSSNSQCPFLFLFLRGLCPMEDPQISQNGTNVQERGGTLFSWPIFFCFTSIRFSYLVDLTFSGEGGWIYPI